MRILRNYIIGTLALAMAGLCALPASAATQTVIGTVQVKRGTEAQITASTTAKDGEPAYATDTNHWFCGFGGTYHLVIGQTGAAGQTGPTGLQGATGPIGLTGATGAQGVAGANGQPGPQGIAGATGQPGAQGPSGPNFPWSFTGSVLTTAPTSINVTGAGATLSAVGNALTLNVPGYTLPVGSATTLGGYKVGGGLSVDAGGVLSRNALTNGDLPQSPTFAGTVTANTFSVPYNASNVGQYVLYATANYGRRFGLYIDPDGNQGGLQADSVLNLLSNYTVTVGRTSSPLNITTDAAGNPSMSSPSGYPVALTFGDKVIYTHGHLLIGSVTEPISYLDNTGPMVQIQPNAPTMPGIAITLASGQTAAASQVTSSTNAVLESVSSAGVEQAAGYKSSDGSAGETVTIPLASLTAGGTQGSITYKNGLEVAHVNPT